MHALVVGGVGALCLLYLLPGCVSTPGSYLLLNPSQNLPALLSPAAAGCMFMKGSLGCGNHLSALHGLASLK